MSRLDPSTELRDILLELCKHAASEAGNPNLVFTEADYRTARRKILALFSTALTKQDVESRLDENFKKREFYLETKRQLMADAKERGFHRFTWGYYKNHCQDCGIRKPNPKGGLMNSEPNSVKS